MKQQTGLTLVRKIVIATKKPKRSLNENCDPAIVHQMKLVNQGISRYNSRDDVSREDASTTTAGNELIRFVLTGKLVRYVYKLYQDT